MKKRTALMILLALSLVTVFSCAPGAEENTLPENFTTYTYPDEFSLSFPADWELDYEYERSTDELAVRMAGNPDKPLLEVVQIVLYGGLPGGADYEPTVIVSVAPRFSGFFTMKEIYETDHRMFVEELEGYKENKVIRTTIDGREATIVDSEDNQPEYGERRYLILTTPSSSLVWYVICSVAADDYGQWEDTFKQVVYSLRILK